MRMRCKKNPFPILINLYYNKQRIENKRRVKK